MWVKLTAKAGGLTMRQQLLVLAVCVGLAASYISGAENDAPAALTGVVTSAAEGAMEGVLVSAKRADSTITVTVVSDDHGRYRFPAAKLQIGRASCRERV